MSFNKELTSFSCTLNRAHKLAERVRQMLNDEISKARTAFAPVALQGYAGDGQVASLLDQGELGAAALARHAVLNDALYRLRAAIGRANVEAGVHDLLAEQDALNRRLQALRSLLDCRPKTAVDPDDLPAYQCIGKSDGVLRASMITVSTMPLAALSTVQAEVSALEKALYALSDRIAERNLTKIAVSIDAQLAQDIGLVTG